MAAQSESGLKPKPRTGNTILGTGIQCQHLMSAPGTQGPPNLRFGSFQCVVVVLLHSYINS